MGRLIGIHGVEGLRGGFQRLHQFQRVFLLELRLAEIVILCIQIEGESYAVVVLPERVEVVEDSAETLGTGVACHLVHVCQVEAAVEVEDDTLRGECLPAVGDGGAVGEIL